MGTSERGVQCGSDRRLMCTSVSAREGYVRDADMEAQFSHESFSHLLPGAGIGKQLRLAASIKQGKQIHRRSS